MEKTHFYSPTPRSVLGANIWRFPDPLRDAPLSLEVALSTKHLSRLRTREPSYSDLDILDQVKVNLSTQPRSCLNVFTY